MKKHRFWVFSSADAPLRIGAEFDDVPDCAANINFRIARDCRKTFGADLISFEGRLLSGGCMNSQALKKSVSTEHWPCFTITSSIILILSDHFGGRFDRE